MNRGRTPRSGGAVGLAASRRLAATLTSSASAVPGREYRYRPTVETRFVHIGGKKQYLRGVTYGTFGDGADGVPYPDPATVARDFAAMAAAGANAIRLYTAPPRWLLDLAGEHGLVAMVGLAWEEHVAFLDDRRRAARIVERIERDAAALAGHPALLCYAAGNEIPTAIVRWHGHRRIERFIERLYSAVKGVDPEGLVTYVNYPSTEYLQLPFLDLVCFNVYLESVEPLQKYLARLHNMAGDRPLLITELGLDSRRNGAEVQARAVESQLRAAYASGCAGAFVFAWTDEWNRGGVEVGDWHFGLVDRERRPKPALAAVERAFVDVPLAEEMSLPRVSVVVCSYNGEATIGHCLDAIDRLDYPDYEVIVVDDGSTDHTAEIASGFDVRLIRTENRGLSAARNTGIGAATGEIVAFTDDDASPDPDWLTYLAHTFGLGDHAGVGGPNLAPGDVGLVERAVAYAPGGPIQVLISDGLAEHIPGCNMAFRREVLEAVGGFDPQFRIAGDDVDMCWRLQDRGLTIAYSPAAVVLHRRRRSVRMYLRQQAEYGKAEALLERKWPQRYNRGGHVAWSGQVLGGAARPTRWRPRIGYGTWGTNLFQSIYDRTPSTLVALPLMPEWYLLLAALAALSLLGVFETPLVPWTAGSPVPVELLLLAAAGAALAVSAVRIGLRVPRSRRDWFAVRGLTIMLSLLQPVARLVGRLRYGLTPWRRRGEELYALPWPRSRQSWSEHWQSHGERLLELERDLCTHCMNVRRGAEFDRWDLQVRVGPMAVARMRVAVEEHGHGRQLARYRVWPRWSRLLAPVTGLLVLWLAVSIRHEPYLALGIGVLLVFVLLRALRDACAGIAAVLRSVEREKAYESDSPKLLDDVLVTSVRSLIRPNHTDDAREGAHDGRAEKAAALDHHG